MSNPFFSDTLKSFIGYSVGVFSHDGTLMKGTIVDVKKDYLILQNTEGKYIYYQLAQIKSVSKNVKDLQANTVRQDYLQTEQLHEILEQCKYSWVTVNCYNDQLITGFLSRVFDDHLILISEEETIIMQNASIINIFPGVYEFAGVKGRDQHGEKESSSQIEAKDERSENEASSKDTGADQHGEKEPPTQIEAKDERSENEAFLKGTMEKEVEKQVKEPSKQIKDAQNLESSQITVEIDKEAVTEENTTTTVSADYEDEKLSKQYDEKKGNISFDHNQIEQLTQPIPAAEKVETDSYKHITSKPFAKPRNKVINDSLENSSINQKHAQKSQARKRVKTSKAEKDTDSTIDKSSDAAPLEIAVEEPQEIWTPGLTIEEAEKQLESRYYSLMKQAEKNYKILQERRIGREMMNK
ncbi:hypothetical protein BA724_14660 [Domibacillus iocasae]|uniref:DUF2642 domain-containing protein n=2 Tax=Domibacillus iocasae TaxID=1714016 RepID=A0A1E7DTQ3_9BACI|nr:DUF2642 domain-containing protein [Domibacillus iocasae]OES46467.1 hypothetical protein BA724_14660 [Domibacillus iocasae]